MYMLYSYQERKTSEAAEKIELLLCILFSLGKVIHWARLDPLAAGSGPRAIRLTSLV